ncbi:efflux RND transporter periplasmic adaptor subunit [Flavobacteriaceae bacterium S0862]|nr:efflux RND transporter periplasmic adaptor subunit [Flavobacteriaceae bacterium S0862]
MKNNKIIIYIGILVIGVLLGWLLFGGQSNNQIEHNHIEVANANQMWTCSMHPQILKPEAGDCPICGMDLIPAEVGVDGLAADQFKMTENAMALANIETTIIGDIETTGNSVTLSGKIDTNDKESAVQTAHFGGRIETLYFKSEGELVKKGALIASIYSPELVTAQNELIEAIDIKNEQPELYKAVRNKLKSWKISEQQILELEHTSKVIINFNMYANTVGYIETVFVEEGNHVKEGAPLFKVANLNSVWAHLDAYEQDVKNLKIGQDISIKLNAYPNEKIAANIDYIDPVLNNKTRTVTVRATLANYNGKLKPGMLISGRVQLDTNTENSLVSIPKSAVMWTGKRSIVYVKVAKGSPVFELREVELGNATGTSYIVLKGLNNGEEIVTNGTFTIDAAAQLQGKRSMMNNAKTEEEKGKKIERLKVSNTFQNQLKSVVDSYLLLKENLVLEKAINSKGNAQNLLDNMVKVDMKLLANNDAHMQWMTLEKEIKASANSIVNSNDIVGQRKHFKPLSKYLTNAVALFGINQTIYSQFCPMADNDKGGFWLSLEEEIQNPYFGDAMLRCGSVEQIIN